MSIVRDVIVLAALLLLASAPVSLTATQPPKTEVVPKWDRFECGLESSVVYTNPLQDAALRAVFTSPSGEEIEVPGFWDGGNRWRIRFSPGELGRWSFTTYCSDPANKGLSHRQGGFLCSTIVGRNPISQHGPVRVSADGRRFEHRDGTPFFLSADTALEGGIKSTLRDWQVYANTRALQGFNTIVWAATPGKNARGEVGVGGFSDKLQLNPDYFRELDGRLDALRQAGLLSVVVPFSEALADRDGGAKLTPDQLSLLLRYLIARWDSSPVIWLLPVEGTEPTVEPSRWKRLGKEVFAQARHAPVMVQGRMHSPMLDAFREENWVGAFGCSVLSHDPAELAKELGSLGFGDDASLQGKLRPTVPFLPEETSPVGSNAESESADLVRHAAAWTLLSSRPAGFCALARGVNAWETGKSGTSELRGFPEWRSALYMPGARQLSGLAAEFAKLPFWNLKPAGELVDDRSRKTSPLKFTAVAAADDGSTVVAYTPQGDPIQFKPGSLPASGMVTWFNPRTDESTSGTGPIGTEVKPPAAGDWLLIIRGSR